MLLNLVIISSTIFLVVLSIIHCYWLFGGRWGHRAAIPDRFHFAAEDSGRHIGLSVATFLVALGLLAMAWLMFLNHPTMSDMNPPTSRPDILLKIIGSIFIIRAVGDGKVLGLFKRPSNTKFAYYDTRLYIPICLFLGFSFWVVAW